MLDLSKKVLPSAVFVGGKAIAVKTDFHWWLQMPRMLADFKKDGNVFAFDCFYADEPPADRGEGLKALLEFAEVKSPLPRGRGGERVVDFEQDADLIFSAFMQCYRIDLCESGMHWHKFNALMSGLIGTKLNEVAGIRSFDKNDRRKWEDLREEAKRAWALEERLTDEEQAALARFDALFEGKTSG